MLAHLVNLIVRSFQAIPASRGSNWLGLIFPVLVVIVGEVIVAFIWGWGMVRSNWKKATGIGFAALTLMYTLLFAWCVITTTYGDHVGLASRVAALRHVVDQDATKELLAVNEVHKELEETKQTCSELRGENRVLDNQTKTQQASIDNCQTQAMKLLAPEVEEITPLILVDRTENEVDHNETYILITNKVVTPVLIVGSCDVLLISVFARPLGIGTYSGGAQITGKSRAPITPFDPQQQGSASGFRIDFSTPAWSPKSPIFLEVHYTSSRSASCNFSVR